MRRVGRILFGFRDDIDLNERWWHRLAKVAFVLVICGWTLWFALTIPAELPSGPGNARAVETLADYVKSPPDDGDPVASFVRKYGYRYGKLQADGGLAYAFFETDLYCAVHPYEHLNDLAAYLRPSGSRRPTAADALEALQTLKIPRTVQESGYTCLQINSPTPSPTEIVGWEHTTRAHIIGNLQKFAIILVGQTVFWFVVLNLYYRGFVFIVCGPRKKLSAGV